MVAISRSIRPYIFPIYYVQSIFCWLKADGLQVYYKVQEQLPVASQDVPASFSYDGIQMFSSKAHDMAFYD